MNKRIIVSQYYVLIGSMFLLIAFAGCTVLVSKKILNTTLPGTFFLLLSGLGFLLSSYLSIKNKKAYMTFNSGILVIEGKYAIISAIVYMIIGLGIIFLGVMNWFS